MPLFQGIFLGLCLFALIISLAIDFECFECEDCGGSVEYNKGEPRCIRCNKKY